MEMKWQQLSLGGTSGFCQQLFEPADDSCLSKLASRVGVVLPADYLAVMRATDGFDGMVGPNSEDGSWVQLLSCSEALTQNSAYDLEVTEPNLYLLGGSGGGLAYLLDTKSLEWVELPFMDFGCTGTSRLERRFSSLTDMLAALAGDPQN